MNAGIPAIALQRRARRRSGLLAAGVLLASGCGADTGWRCRPLAMVERCEATALALPPAPWRCHEWRGHLLCAAPADSSPPQGAWSCRRDGGWFLCRRSGLPFPPVPAAARKAAGGDRAAYWRCAIDDRGARRCRPRSWGNGPWQCEGDRCRQAYPDVPNEWEWECYEADGRVICHTSTPGPVEDGWACRATEEYPQLCVDPDPDYPDLGAGVWSCRLEHMGEKSRICRRNSSPTGVCSSDAECPAGFCIERRCVPARLSPDCFFPRECKSASCLGGTCA